MFTSIGKNTISTTTAALEGQPKPNHITMIGAMPTMGSAAMKLPTGRSRAAARRSGPRGTATSEPGGDADREA